MAQSEYIRKITTVAMSAFVLLCLVALLFGKTAAAIIAILQIVLTVAAVLMKKQVIKVPQKWLHIVALVLAVILLVPYMTLLVWIMVMPRNLRGPIFCLQMLFLSRNLIWERF